MSNLGVNYSALSKAVYARVTSPEARFERPADLIFEIAIEALLLDAVESARVIIDLPRGPLHARSLRYSKTFHRVSAFSSLGASFGDEGDRLAARWCEIVGLQVACVIGLHPHERKERQRIEVDVKVWDYSPQWAHKAFADSAMEVRTSSAG